MKLRRRILLIVLTLVLAALSMTLASCSLLDKFLNKNDTVAPSIVNVIQLKTDLNYLTSKEYLYNKDSGAIMPLRSGESFLLQIEYENPGNHSISYVKINNEKIMASKFEEGSDKTKTIIKLKVSDDKTTREETFTVNSIFYNAGTETKRVPFNDEFDMNFKVVVEPSYYLTLNYQNADRRAATVSEDQKSARQMISYKADLASYSVANPDYSAVAGLPFKPGGWVFEGYFTEPNGRGMQVTKDDYYFFWGDVTLYAHFSRLFTYEIVDLLPTIGINTIDYTYSRNGEQQTKTFYKGAVITGNTKKGHPNIDIGDTLVDEVANYNKETGAFINFTATEYPIIKISNNAFKDVNTVINLSIGKFVVEIGAYAFENCNKMEKVTFSNGSWLKYIGDCAFQKTTNMGVSYPFTIPENVEYIGNFAFRNSGWKNTENNGKNESELHIRPEFKFLGVECFFGTKFSKVIFEPGCHFDGQINLADGEAIDDIGGWRSIGNMAETGEETYPKLIGSGLFANSPLLIEVVFEGKTVDDVYVPALNIIPDLAFDRENYTTTGLIAVRFDEGVEYIGTRAFTYQEKLQQLILPASLREVDKKAFYNCTSVYDLTFREDRTNNVFSQLRVLRSSCFGNMLSLVRVQIVSTVMERYGNGPFANCDNLKSIEFPYIESEEQLPRGYSEAEDSSEVYVGHLYSDFMYSTFESGKIRTTDGTDAQQTYAVPTRVFCKESVLNKFKQILQDGKKLKAGGMETGNGAYRDSIFLYDINLIYRDYVVDPTNTNSAKTDIALQKIYSASNDAVIGYSMAFWSDRSKNITIPASLTLTIDGSQQTCNIIQIGPRALPTSVQTITVPASVTRISNDAFNNCTELTEVRFDNINTLEYIGDYAFMGTLITSFTGGTNLKVIGQYAFWNCSSLRWVDLSACSYITNAYAGRTKVKTQYIYEYEKAAIGKGTNEKDALDYNNALYNGAFQGCRSLTWIYLPPNISRMSQSLLAGCRNLTTVIIENPNVPTSTQVSDPGEICFYPYAQATSVYDSEAIAKGMTIYGNNIESTHRLIFSQGNYKIFGVEMPGHP
ncbi:MAG TPA: leucine-rich repeat protein [Clostridia bacterium]|nr:leucine-rich repeat protein [Clostridia bacterium]